MSFFYDLNKKLDSIRATPEVTHQQLNERDLGKHNNATTGFAALAKKTGGGEKGARIAGKQLAHMREKGQVEEGGWNPVDEPVAKSSAAKRSSSKQPDPNVPGSMIVVGPDTGPPPKKTDDNRLYKDSVPVDEPVKKTTNEAEVDEAFTLGLDPRNDQEHAAIVNKERNLYRPGVADKKRDDELTNRGYDRAQDVGFRTMMAQQRKKKEAAANAAKANTLGGRIKSAVGMGEAGVPMTAKQRSFAKLAPPADKITFADKIAGAKKEVDEVLGDVAANAMKKALGSGRGRNAEMDESFWDDEPTSRRSSTGGRIDTSQPGRTIHRAVKGNYSGAGHDAGAETSSSSSDGPRGRGRPKGSKAATGAKINRGTSKLMTREGDQDLADQGEYDREGEMGRNEIHTMMRNAKQLEKMLGNDDNLPEWVQKKLSLASDYMQTIADYLASEKETDAEDHAGMELAEKKAKPTKKSSGNDGNLANNAKPYDKVTRGDVVAGRLGKDEMGGKKKPSKAPAKEEEVEESTTAGSVATAPTSGKASKGGMTFGKGIYDSINRAVETQINESMNISMNMSTDEQGGPGQSLTITATDEDAVQLAQLLKMAGLGGGDEGETCDTCGMADCGCGDMEQMDETYGDNAVDMNSPDYPTNTEKAQDNFGYAGGLNKHKASGMATIPVTDVNIDGDDRFARSAHYAESRDELARIREIAGIKPVSEDKAEWLKPEGMPSDEPTAPGGVEKKKEGDVWVYKPKEKDERLTATIPSRYTDPDKKKNESIFTDTANLWKRYKG